MTTPHPHPPIDLKNIKSHAASQRRELVPPKVKAQSSSLSQQHEIVQLAHKVMAEHRSVLIALKNR